MAAMVSAEEALETYEDEIGLTYALDESEPTKHMRALWDELPCYLQAVTENESRILVASKAPLTPEQVAWWLELRKASVDEEISDEDPAFAWSEVCGELYDTAYKAQGPSKHEIEEMHTDAEYETACVQCVVSAYEEWEHEGKPDFGELSQATQLRYVVEALNKGSYGSYRGNLPEHSAVLRALEEVY